MVFEINKHLQDASSENDEMKLSMIYIKQFMNKPDP